MGFELGCNSMFLYFLQERGLSGLLMMGVTEATECLGE